MGLVSYFKNLYYNSRFKKAEARLDEGRSLDGEQILSSILDKHPLAAARLAEYYFSQSETAAVETVVQLYEKVLELEGKGGQVYDAKAYDDVLSAFTAKINERAEHYFNLCSYSDVSLLLASVNKAKWRSDKSLNLCCKSDTIILFNKIEATRFNDRGFLALVDEFRTLWVRGTTISELRDTVLQFCCKLKQNRRYYVAAVILGVLYGDKYHASCLDNISSVINGDDSEIHSSTIKDIVKTYGKQIVIRRELTIDASVDLFDKCWRLSNDSDFVINTVGAEIGTELREAIVSHILSCHSDYLTNNDMHLKLVDWIKGAYGITESIELYEKIYALGYDVECNYVLKVHDLCSTLSGEEKLHYLDKAQLLYPQSKIIIKDKLDCASWFERQDQNTKAIEVAESIIPNCEDAKLVKAKALCNIANKDSNTDDMAHHAKLAAVELENVNVEGISQVRQYVYQTYQAAAEKYYSSGTTEKCYAILHQLSKYDHIEALVSIVTHRLDEVKKCLDACAKRTVSTDAINEVSAYDITPILSTEVFKNLWTERIYAVLEVCKTLEHKQTVIECENLTQELRNVGFDTAYTDEKVELLRKCIIKSKYVIARELELNNDFDSAILAYKEINALENKRTPTLSALRFILCKLKSEGTEDILKHKDKIYSLLDNAAKAYKAEKDDIAYRFALILLKAGEDKEALDVVTTYLPEEDYLKKACEQGAMIKAQAKLEDFNLKLEAVKNKTLSADDALCFINHMLEYAEIIKPILDLPRTKLSKYRNQLKNYAIFKLFDESKFDVAFEKMIKEHSDYLEDLTALRNLAVVCLNTAESNLLTSQNYKEVISVWLTAIYQENLFVKSLDYTSWDNQFKFTLQSAYGHFDEFEYDDLPDNVSFEDPDENVVISIREVQRSLLDRFEAAISENQIYHEFFTSQKGAMDAFIDLNLDQKCKIVAPYLMYKDKDIAEDIFDALEQDQQQHYGNWEEVLSVGVAYNINRPIYRDFDTARQCVRDCRVAIEEKKDLTTLKLIFKADKIDNIKTFDNLYSSLVSFLNTKVSALRMDDKAMFKSNFERYIIVCEAVRDSATSFAFSGYVMNHIVGEVNEKRMKNSDASNYIVSIFLLDPTNNRVKDNLKTLFEMLVRENTATSKRTVTTILNKVAACNSSFHGELKKVYEEAQIDVELEGIFKKIKNNSITRLNALKAVHDLYKTNPSNKGVCTVLAQLCVVCIEEYVIGDKYGKEGVKSILNAIKTNKTAQFSSNSNVFSERYHAIWSQLPSEAKQLISLGFGPAGTTLSDKGYALKEGLNLLKDFGGVTNSGLGGGLFDFI